MKPQPKPKPKRDVKDQLRSVLARPVRTPAEASQAEQAARVLRGILEAELRAEQVLVRETAPAYASGRTLAGLTIHEAARRVLERAGAPLHAQEIGVRMKAAGWRHPRSSKAKPEQIVHALAAQLPKHSTFKRVRPQTFALAEWVDTGKEPPAPLVGIFEGPGGPTGRRISGSEPAAGASAWRSS